MKSIYVVEDDPGIRELLEFLLSANHYEVEAFEKARPFTERLSIRQPDCVLLDIRLPDGDGVEIGRNLFLDEDTKDIPVILMSANVEKSEINGSGARDFITKPFDIEDLLERVQKQVEAML